MPLVGREATLERMSDPQRILLVTRHLAPLTGDEPSDRDQAETMRRLAAAGHDVRAVVPATALTEGVEGLSPLIEALMVPDQGLDHPVGVKVATLAPQLPVYVLEGDRLEGREALTQATRAISVRLSWYPDTVLEGTGPW